MDDITKAGPTLEHPELLPAVVREEWNRLARYLDEKNYHGAIFGIKDGYEVIIKFICLCVCAGMAASGDDSCCAVLLNPEKSLSFGDWTNDVLLCARKSTYAASRPELQGFLKKAASFYGQSGIVAWRNDTLGHGLMDTVIDEDAQKEILTKAAKLCAFINKERWPEELMPRDMTPLSPFILADGNHALLFDSLDRRNTPRYIDCADRRRVIRRDIPFWTEKREKYFGVLRATETESLKKDVYTSDQDIVLSGFHLTTRYMKPDYMVCWLQGCLAGAPSGVFLMQGARNTGKSSFVSACDGLFGHGQQKIPLDGATIRAYYCSRTDISFTEDFAEHVDDLLRQLPDGRQLRSRAGSLPTVRHDGLGGALRRYREIYDEHAGTEKLVLFIDAIDELTPQSVSLLRHIPAPAEIPDGVYIVVTCRSEMREISPAVADFVMRYPFTGRVVFDEKKENRQLLIRCLESFCELPAPGASTMADAMDNKFHMLPLLAYFSAGEIISFLAEDGTLMAERPALAYLERLRTRYGAELFGAFEELLGILADTAEPLSIHELAALLGQGGPSERLLCFIKDASPFLTEYRSYRGNVYCFSQVEMRAWVKLRYPAALTRCAERWEAELLCVSPEQDDTIMQAELDGYLCMALLLPTIEKTRSFATAIALTKSIAWICWQVGPQNKLHQLVWALHGMETVTATLDGMTIPEDRELDCFRTLILTAQHMLHLYHVVRQFQVCEQMIGRLEPLLDRFSRREWLDTDLYNLAVFYSDVMLYYAELYRTDEAKRYYQKAMELLLSIRPQTPGMRERLEEMRDSLQINLVGVLRQFHYDEIEGLLGQLREKAERAEHGYSDVNHLLMISMAYKSGGRFPEAERVLQEAREQIEALDAAGVPRDPELYAHVHWRLCQCLSERELWGAEVTPQEVREAIGMMNALLTQAIDGDARGVTLVSQWKAKFMTTGVNLRVLLMRLLSQNEDAEQSDEFQAVAREAIHLARAVDGLYREQERTGFDFDRVIAMDNLRICAGLYVQLRWYDEAEARLTELLDRFPPRNAAEESEQAEIRAGLAAIEAERQNNAG